MQRNPAIAHPPIRHSVVCPWKQFCSDSFIGKNENFIVRHRFYQMRFCRVLLQHEESLFCGFLSKMIIKPSGGGRNRKDYYNLIIRKLKEKKLSSIKIDSGPAGKLVTIVFVFVMQENSIPDACRSPSMCSWAHSRLVVAHSSFHPTFLPIIVRFLIGHDEK